ILRDLIEKRLDYIRRDGTSFFDAARNAALVASAERYYRAMYLGSVESWNLRDEHMFETLRSIVDQSGAARVLVWEHNTPVGDADRPATEVQRHCFKAARPGRFDELGWFGEARAARPLAVQEARGELPETYPFGF